MPLFALAMLGIYVTDEIFAAAPVAKKANAPAGLRADIDNTDVYLNDSFEATDALHQVSGLIRRNRWSDAASLLQTTSDRLGDKLIRISAGHYAGLQEHIHHLIAKWPAQGIASYRMLYERELKNELSSITRQHDVTKLLPLFDRYFCTRQAGEMADTIGQLAIESGDLSMAEYVYQRVLDHHPDAKVHAQTYRAQLMIIASMRKNNPHISDQDKKTQRPWMGKPQTLSEIVSHIQKNFQPVHHNIGPDDWPIFGGDDTRCRKTSTQVDELGLLWKYSFNKKNGNPRDSSNQEPSSSDYNLARKFTLHPIVSDGLVVIQNTREIVAIHIKTGEVVWKYLPDDQAAEMDYLDDRLNGWDAVTIHDGRVYASLPGDAMPYYSYDSTRNPHELICLDAKNGKVLWQLSQHDFEDRFSEIHFDSSPIVRQGHVYIVGRRRRSFGFEDCYLFRINAMNGKVESQTHLGSASTGSFGSHPATKAAAALHGDTVYVCSNLGTVAAVSAHTGIVRWLRLYDRDRDGNGDQRTSSDTDPWRFQPVVWSEDQIVIWPTDSSNVMILSADDGRLLKSVPAELLGSMEMFLGVHNGVICGAGKQVSCYDLNNDEVSWIQSFPESSKPYGLGTWVDDRLMIPTTQGISSFQLTDGQRNDISWNAGTRGGNLLPLPEYILVADHESISAYVRKSDIWKSLRDQMTEAPTDPAPALEMAEVALRSGEMNDALTALKEADRRANLDQVQLQAAVQHRLFQDAIHFANILSERAALQDHILDDLFHLAAQYAPDMASNLQYRLRFASLFENQQKPARALRLYQQILQDRALRNLPIQPSSPTSPLAKVEATDRIASLINDQGRSIYQTYETQASQWLESGQQALDIALLQHVVDTFPNSLAAPRAMIVHGEIAIQRDQPVEAATLFARAYHRYTKEVDRPGLLKKIADAYEHAGRKEHAYRWLSKAANEHPSVTFEHDGQMMTFLAYRSRLDDIRNRIEPKRPDITTPINKTNERSFGPKTTLLEPRFAEHPRSFWLQYYVYTEEGIVAMNAQDGSLRWDQPADLQSHVELLLATEKFALFSTLQRVMVLDAESGRTLWKIGKDTEQQDAGIDWEALNVFRSHTVYGNVLISVHDNGEVYCIDIESGKTIWKQEYHPAPKSILYVADPWATYHYVRDGKVVLAMVDLTTGKRTRTIDTNITRPVEEIFSTLDGQIAVVTSRSITSYDVETRKKRWHLRLNGTLQRASLLLDLDAVYFSQDNREVQKVSLEDGSLLWETEQLLKQGEDDMTLHKVGNYLIVSSNHSVNALDPVTGLILWKGTTSQHPRLISRLLTQSYIVAVDLESGLDQKQSVAYFYDHRNASGVIPQGGSVPLGTLEDIRVIMAVDRALLIQTGSTIHRYAQP